MKTIQITNTHQSLLSPLHARYCDSFFCRLRGLMFRSRLSPEEGLLLVEARESRLDTSIHMLFVFMDLGVVWLDSSQMVVDIIVARKWRPVYTPCQPARYTLEIQPQRLNEFQIGDNLEFIHD
jgi:hypothetical protein